MALFEIAEQDKTRRAGLRHLRGAWARWVLAMAALFTALGPATAMEASGPSYAIGPGDRLTVSFFYNPELNVDIPVQPDGYVSLQLIGPIRVAGLTTAALRNQLVELYKDVVKVPEINVAILDFGSQQIYVGGEVRNPAALPLRPGMTPAQAIIMAGGHKLTAKLGNVVVIRDTGSGEPQPVLVDLRSEFRGEGDDSGVALQARDVIYVPPTNIARVGNFVDQYVNQIVPSWFSVSYQRFTGDFRP